MNMAAAFYTKKDTEVISAYNQSLGKPALSLPYTQIKGGDANASDRAVAPAGAAK